MVFNLILLTLFLPLSAEIGFSKPWGKDTDLIYQAPLSTGTKKRTDVLGRFSENVILFHQNILSPVDGPRSHFRPTSSRYMLLAVRRYGFLKGTIMGFDRLLRENSAPWVYRTKTIDGIKYKWDPTYK